jgi:putative ABC transport system permease protein
MMPPRLALRMALDDVRRARTVLPALAATVCALWLGASMLPMLALAACIVTADTALHTLARRRMLATLRALGMTRAMLVAFLLLQALWISAVGSLLGIIAGRTICGLLVEGMATCRTPAEEGVLLTLLLGVALLAALVPAIRAARADVARGLASLPPHQDP